MSVELPISPSLVDAHRAAVAEVNCWRGRCVDHYARIEARMSEALAAVAAHADGAGVKDPHMFGAKAKLLGDLVSDGARFHAKGNDLRAALEQATTVLAARNSIIHATGNVLIGLHDEWAWLYRFQPSGTDKAPQDGWYDRESANVFQTELRSCRHRLENRLIQFAESLGQGGRANSPPPLSVVPVNAGAMKMSDTKGHGSHAAKKANAAAAKEGKSNPRTSSKAQSILGKKGAAAKKKD